MCNILLYERQISCSELKRCVHVNGFGHSITIGRWCPDISDIRSQSSVIARKIKDVALEVESLQYQKINFDLCSRK
jgi:hypothetical protein